MDDFLDDRDQQLSLSIGEEAARTEDRSGETITGSTSFLDDRDERQSGSTDTSEQGSLFGESDEIDGQKDLFGGQASNDTAGFFEQNNDSPGLLSTDERALGAAEAEREAPAFPEAQAFDFSMSPGEAFEGVGATSGRSIGGFDPIKERETDRFDRETAPPGLSKQEPADFSLGFDDDPVGSGSVQSVDLKKLDIANGIRDRFGEHLAESDHGGRTTVKFKPSTPEGVINQAELARDEITAETSRSQTVTLREKDRDRIKNSDGFDTKTTTANWRSAKGVFAREGLSDQFTDAIGSLADYDDPIEGAEEYVSRHKRRQSQAGVGGVGARDIGEEDISGRQRAGRAAVKEQQNVEQQAIEGAKEGYQEAIDALVIEAGWDRSEAEALAGRVEDPADSMTENEFKDIVEVEIVRARSNGRFTRDPTADIAGKPGQRSTTNGRFLGTSFTEPDIGRDPADGRFTKRGGGL